MANRKIPPNAPRGQNLDDLGTDRDSLLQPGERWHRVGRDCYIAAPNPPQLAEDIDSIDMISLLLANPHDTNHVHLKHHGGGMVISVASDVWATIVEAMP